MHVPLETASASSASFLVLICYAYFFFSPCGLFHLHFIEWQLAKCSDILLFYFILFYILPLNSSIHLYESIYVLFFIWFYFSCTRFFYSSHSVHIYINFARISFLCSYFFYSLILNKLLYYLRFVCVWQNEVELDECVRGNDCNADR